MLEHLKILFAKPVIFRVSPAGKSGAQTERGHSGRRQAAGRRSGFATAVHLRNVR